MDSIIKNIGGDYIPCFASNLFQSFTSAYAVVPPQVRLSLNRLLSTWPPFFGLDLVSAMHRAVAQHQPQPQLHATPQPLSQNIPMQAALSASVPLNTAAAAPLGVGIGMGNAAPAPRHTAGLLLRSVPPARQSPADFSGAQPAAGLHGAHLMNGMPIPPTTSAAFGGNVPNMMGVRTQPAVSGGFAGRPGVGAAAVGGVEMVSQEFLRTQELMSEISRKANMGIRPSNHQLFNMNRLITTQLTNSNTPPAHRTALLRFQQQLREAASLSANPSPNANVSHLSNANNMHMPLQNQNQTQTLSRLAMQNTNMNQNQPVANHTIPPLKPMPLAAGAHAAQFLSNAHVPPPTTTPLSSANANASGLLNSLGGTQALSGLLRSIPRGLLSSTKVPPTSAAVMHMNSTSSNPQTGALPAGAPGLGGAVHRPGPQGPYHFQGMQSIREMPDIPRREEPTFAGGMPTPLKFSQLDGMSHASAVRALYVDLPHMSKGDGMRFATKEQLRNHLDWVFQQNKRKRSITNRESLGGHSRSWYAKANIFIRQGLSDKDASNGVGSSNEKSKNDPSGLDNNNRSNSINYDRNNKKGLSAGGISSRDGIGVGTNGFDPSKSTDFFSGLPAADISNDANKTCAVPVKGDNECCAACGETFETFWDDDRGSWMLSDAVRLDDGEVFHTKCLESTQTVTGAADSDSEHSEEHVKHGEDDAEGTEEQKPQRQPSTDEGDIDIVKREVKDVYITEVVSKPKAEPESSGALQEVKATNIVKTEVGVLTDAKAAAGGNATAISSTKTSNKQEVVQHENDTNKKRKLNDGAENTDSGLNGNIGAADLDEQLVKKVKTEAMIGEQVPNVRRIVDEPSGDIKETET